MELKAKTAGPEEQKGFTFVAPRLRDPRLMLIGILSGYSILGQTLFFFNINMDKLGAALAASIILDFVITTYKTRKIQVPLSGIITGLSLGLLLESYLNWVFVIAAVWSIASKHLIKVNGRHIFNPSNFGIVAVLLLGHGMATVAPGSQWGGDLLFALVVLSFGMIMSYRVKRLALVAGWVSGYITMGLLRVALGQGGLIFALGPMTGAEFMLFTISMVPDPPTSPARKDLQFGWGLSIAFLDGIMRLGEVRFSMFYALFILCAIRPWFEIALDRVLSGVRRTADVPGGGSMVGQPVEVSK